MQQTQKKGFTLIELLVVIAIIGILSAIGLVSLNGAREKARDAQRKSDLSQIRTALALYYDDFNSSYPGTAANSSVSLASGAVNTALVPSYLDRMPAPPGTGCAVTTYNYAANAVSNATQFSIWARLEAPNCTRMYVLNSLGFGGEYTHTATPTLVNTDCGGTGAIETCVANGGTPTG